MQLELNFEFDENLYDSCEQCQNTYCKLGISFKCDEPFIKRGMK
jgi:hypothetical protein